MEEKAKPAKRWLIPVLLLLVILLLVVILLVVLLGRSSEPTTITDNPTPMLAYAEGTVAIDEESLQQAVDAMLEKAKEGTIALSYKNDAFSSDGETFSCYIANSPQNSYDMFINIYADAALTDQLYLSGLVRPGDAFEEITLDHSLAEGTHRVFVVYTQVEEDLATIHAQVSVTMDFNVRK